MVRELVHDPMLLGVKSKPATKQDAMIARDLLDTLTAHSETCVGMAANMIGKTVRIIAFNDNGRYIVMYNNKGEVSGQQFSVENQILHGLYRADNPARGRPLQRRTDINNINAGGALQNRNAPP